MQSRLRYISENEFESFLCEDYKRHSEKPTQNAAKVPEERKPKTVNPIKHCGKCIHGQV
jgi:hypothetical protein